MAFPKIVYNSVTLNFSVPPPQVTEKDEMDVRNINVASSGVAEIIYERTDEFVEFTPDYIPDADKNAWESFLDWARQGMSFDFYPDAALGSFTTCTMENKDRRLTRRSPGIWQLPGLKLRKVVTP